MFSVSTSGFIMVPSCSTNWVQTLYTGVPIGHWKRPDIYYWHAAVSVRPRQADSTTVSFKGRSFCSTHQTQIRRTCIQSRCSAALEWTSSWHQEVNNTGDI